VGVSVESAGPIRPTAIPTSEEGSPMGATENSWATTNVGRIKRLASAGLKFRVMMVFKE